jgi:uncharacterized protein YndB with AHSA1/START domain
MIEPAVTHSTFVLERTYAKSASEVYAAFSEYALRRRWFAEGEHHEVQEYTLDFRVGGAENLMYRFKEGTPFDGLVVQNEIITLDIVPGQRIVTASTMTFGGNRISASLVTIELLEAGDGTTLVCTHQGAFFEGSDGPQIREAGWRSLFDKLGQVL